MHPPKDRRILGENDNQPVHVAMSWLLGGCESPVGESRGATVPSGIFLPSASALVVCKRSDTSSARLASHWHLDFPEGPDLVDMAARATDSSPRFLFMESTTDDLVLPVLASTQAWAVFPLIRTPWGNARYTCTTELSLEPPGQRSSLAALAAIPPPNRPTPRTPHLPRSPRSAARLTQNCPGEYKAQEGGGQWAGVVGQLVRAKTYWFLVSGIRKVIPTRSPESPNNRFRYSLL